MVAVAKSSLISSSVVSVSPSNPAVVSMTIEYDMIPEVRFLAFENRGEFWTADSLSFFVQENLEHQVTLTPSKDASCKF